MSFSSQTAYGTPTRNSKQFILPKSSPIALRVRCVGREAEVSHSYPASLHFTALRMLVSAR